MTNSMRILHVNKFFDRHGGAEVYLHGLMEHERHAGHEVHIFSTKSVGNLSSADAKYFVTRYDFDRREGAIKDFRKTVNFIWNAEARRSLARQIADVKPDVMHLHNIYHHLSSSVLEPIRAANIPCVMTLHDYKLANPVYGMFDRHGVCEHAKGRKYFEIVKRRCLTPDVFGNALAAFEMWMTKRDRRYERTVQKFLCPSKFMRAKMIEWGEPADQLMHLPNPIEVPADRARRGGGYLLYAGRLSFEKGLETLVEAASRVPSMHIKIAGRGPEERFLRRLIAEHHVANVELLGFIEPEDLAVLRDRAEAVLLPSVSYENASTSLLEGMAAGLPCIASDIGGNPELVEDGVDGLLVKPNNVNEWTRALERFVSLSDEARRIMGERGREKILAEHTWEEHLKRVMECYRG